MDKKKLRTLAILAVAVAVMIPALFLWMNHRKVATARKTLLSLANMEQVFYERSRGYTESLRELSLVIPNSNLAIEAAKASFVPGSLAIEISEDEKSVTLAAQAKDRKKTWVSYTSSQDGSKEQNK